MFVKVIDGDLATLPLSGESLQAKIDTIVHVAAHVHWTHPYEKLRPDNVLATQRLLQFAVSTRLKSFCFISTVSAATSAEEELPHFDEINVRPETLSPFLPPYILALSPLFDVRTVPSKIYSYLKGKRSSRWVFVEQNGR